MNFSDKPEDSVSVRKLNQEELNAWISMQQEDQMILSILFGGDRLIYCDEIIGVYDGDKLASIASIATQGEENSGVPTIVGLYTVKEFRGRNLATLALKKAIELCVEKGLDQIRVDVFSQKAFNLIENHLEPDYRKHLIVNEQAFIIDYFG